MRTRRGTDRRTGRRRWVRAVGVAALPLVLSATASHAKRPATPALDSVRVWATLTADEILVGETTVLEVSVETDGSRPGEFRIPPLPEELDIISTSDFTQSRFALPGGRRRRVRREIVLRARSEGELRIPPISVEVDGESYRSQPLRLNVTATPRSLSEAAAHGPDDEIIFHARFAPDTVYVGQQITLQADVMISDEARIRLRRAPEYFPPEVTGFWTHDLPRAQTRASRTVASRRYQTQSIEKAYFALSPGEYTLPPAQLTYQIRRGHAYAPISEELTTDSLQLVVLPLPDEGQPEDFAGAVGRFRLESSIEPSSSPTGEAVALTVEVEGEGNIRALPPPTLHDVPGVTVHPPSETANLDTRTSIVTGTKRFTWILIPERPGTLEIPAVEFPYFDPESEAYETTRSEPLRIDVYGGPAPSSTAHPDRLGHTVRLEPSGGSRLRWVRSPVFVALQFIPLLAVLGLLVHRRRKSRPRAPSRHTLRRRRDAALRALDERVHDDDTTFFHDLDELIRTALRERTGAPSSRNTKTDEITRYLQDEGVEPRPARQIVDLLERIEHARYAPERPGPYTRRAMVETAAELLETIDRQARNRPLTVPDEEHRAGAMTPASGALILIAVALSMSTESHAQEPPDAAFQEGVEEYGAKNYEAAARAFTTFLKEEPRDANGWYNLGNAYAQAGEPGYATWAWLQALRLRPRDTDARGHLIQIGTELQLIRAAAPGPLSSEETLLVAATAWIIGATTILAYMWTKRRRYGLVGLATILIAGTVLGAWGTPRLRAGLGVSLPTETTLRVAPVPRAEEVTRLGAGTGVRILDRRGDWIRARTLDGAEGWIESEEIGPLRAMSAHGP